MFTSPYAEFNNRTECALVLDRIALEAAFIDNLVARFRDAGPRLSGFLKKQSETLTQAFARSEEPGPGFFSNRGRALRSIKTLSFAEVGERRVSKPEGFTGLFLPYARTLEKTLIDLASLRERAFPHYNGVLADLVTNRDARRSVNSQQHEFDTIKHSRLQLVGGLHAYFQKETGESKTLIKNVIERLADIPPLFQAVSRIEKLHGSVKPKKIDSLVQQCSEYIDGLVERAKKREIDHMTPEALIMIANGAEELGQLVKLTAVVYYDTAVFLHTVDKLATNLR